METIGGCILILIVFSFFIYLVWKRLNITIDEKIVPDRWDGLHHDVDPKFYWFQMVRMVVVLLLSVIVLIFLILGLLFGVRH